MRAALRPMPYRAVVLTIVRRGSCDCVLRLMLEEGTKRTNGNTPPPVWAGGACFGTGAHPVVRSHAAVHALTCRLPRAAVHAVMRCGSRARAPLDMRPRCGAGDRAERFLRLRAAAHAGGRNETDKRGTRPRPYGRGARALGRGASGRVFGRTFRGGAADGEMVRGVRRATNRTIFVAGRGAARPAWRLAQAFFAARQAGRWCAACGVRLTGLFSWGAGRGVAAIRRALWRPAVACGMARPCGWPEFRRGRPDFLRRRGRRGDGARRAACD